MGKKPPASARDVGPISEWGRSLGEGNSYPLQVFLPGKSHRQKSLAAKVHGVPKRVGYDLVTN